MFLVHRGRYYFHRLHTSSLYQRDCSTTPKVSPAAFRNGYTKNPPQIHQRLSACIAMDAGLSRPIRLFISDTIPPIIQWTGLHADRVSTLTQEMAAGNSPSCLITHALYKRLSPSIQSKYATLYYIHHICCYCAEL